MIAALGAAIAAALLVYFFLRRATYNILDPLIVLHFFIPFMAAQVTVLCVAGLVPWDKFPLFWLTLVAYLAGARMASAFFGRETFRELIVSTLERIRRSEVNAVLFFTVGITLVLAVLALYYGAEGDMRQGFARIFRPLVVLQSGLFLLSLVLLLSPKLPVASVVAWMVLLIVPSVAFSGKSVFMPVLYWFGLKLYANRKVVSLRTAFVTSVLGFLGVCVMGFLAYGRSSIVGLLELFVYRLWASGETYIYAYQWDALAAVRNIYHVSFLSYMLHPITSLVGVRAYEKPLGAMLFVQVVGGDVVGGPNPLLPIVLDYFFPNAWALSAAAALVVGLAVVGIRSVGMVFAASRSRYVRLGGIAAAVFSPGMGFSDTSLVLISLIGVISAMLLGVTAELLFSPRPKSMPQAIASAGSTA